MKIRIQKSMASHNGEYWHGPNSEWVKELEGAVLEVEKHNINYYTTKSGKLIHVYNAFELTDK